MCDFLLIDKSRFTFRITWWWGISDVDSIGLFMIIKTTILGVSAGQKLELRVLSFAPEYNSAERRINSRHSRRKVNAKSWQRYCITDNIMEEDGRGGKSWKSNVCYLSSPLPFCSHPHLLRSITLVIFCYGGAKVIENNHLILLEMAANMMCYSAIVSFREAMIQV